MDGARLQHLQCALAECHSRRNGVQNAVVLPQMMFLLFTRLMECLLRISVFYHDQYGSNNAGIGKHEIDDRCSKPDTLSLSGRNLLNSAWAYPSHEILRYCVLKNFTIEASAACRWLHFCLAWGFLTNRTLHMSFLAYFASNREACGSCALLQVALGCRQRQI